VLSPGIPRSGGKLYNEIRLDAGNPIHVILGFTTNPQQSSYGGGDSNSFGFRFTSLGSDQGVQVYHQVPSCTKATSVLRPPQNALFETHNVSLGDKIGLLIDLDTAPWRGLAVMFHLPMNGPPKMIGLMATGLLDAFPDASHFYMCLSLNCYVTRVTINDRPDINLPYHVAPMLRRPGPYVPNLLRAKISYHALLSSMVSPTQLSFKAVSPPNWMSVFATMPFRRAECNYVEFEVVQHHMYTMFGVAPLSLPINTHVGDAANSISILAYPTVTTLDVRENCKAQRTALAEPLELREGVRIGVLLDFTDISTQRNGSLSFYAIIPMQNAAPLTRHVYTTWCQVNVTYPTNVDLFPAFSVHTGGAVCFASENLVTDPKTQLLPLSYE
jgi:hypothetical protein